MIMDAEAMTLGMIIKIKACGDGVQIYLDDTVLVKKFQAISNYIKYKLHVF